MKRCSESMYNSEDEVRRLLVDIPISLADDSEEGRGK
jgi:hypothetical protein